MKKLNKILLSFACLILTATTIFAQTAENKVKVSFDSGLTILSIDGADVSVKKSFEIEPGRHELKMSYYKKDSMNSTQSYSDDDFVQIFDFKEGNNYTLKVTDIPGTKETDSEFYFSNIYYWGVKKTSVSSIYVTMKISNAQSAISSQKGTFKPIVKEDVEKQIQFLQEPPEGLDYEIIGNAKFEVAYSAGKFHEEDVMEVAYYAEKYLQTKDVDAILYTGFDSDKGRRVHRLEGIAVKFKNNTESTEAE